MSTSVFFFGGYNATQTHVDAWVKSAKAQKAAIDFNGFPWPNYGDGSTDDAITTFKKSDEYKSMVATIEASSAGPIYIVGHSSGCAIANSVNTDLKEKDTKKVALVALDGFKPSAKQRNRPSTQVWGAYFGDLNAKDVVKSKNFPEGVAGAKFFPATVKTFWALHFSLVNTATTDKKPATTIETGYAQCNANLVWLC
jgi:thioesterase domain-containing protein